MFLAQHGYQKSGKIAAGLRDGLLDGVVWSPCDETPEALRNGVDEVARAGAVQAVDPQIYVSTLATANTKKLPRYEYYPGALSQTDFTPRRVGEIVRRALDFQRALAVTHIIAPTVTVDSVGSRWAQIASNLSQEALDYWDSCNDERELLLSAAVTESLLANDQEVNALLDDLTGMEAAGVYLLAELNPALGNPDFDDHLARLLWMIYALAELNGYVVWVPHAGLNGYAARVAGAEAAAGGWWQKLNWWSPSHWLDGSGGRVPRPRVALDSLLGEVLVEALGSLYRADRNLYTDVVEGAGPVAADMTGNPPGRARVDRDALAAQFFAVCRELDGRARGSLDERAQRLLADVAASGHLHARVRATGTQLDPRSGGARIAAWQSAVQGLVARAGANP